MNENSVKDSADTASSNQQDERRNACCTYCTQGIWGNTMYLIPLGQNHRSPNDLLSVMTKMVYVFVVLFQPQH